MPTPPQQNPLDECVSFTGDDLFYRPVWQNGRTAAELVTNHERQIKVDVELLHGDIYAIRGDFDLIVSGPLPSRA